MGSLLEVEGLSVRYGDERAIEDLDLVVGAGEVVSLIGPNGAGKSTTLKAISGFVSCNEGAVTLSGERITGLPPYKLVRKGLVLAPEERHVFGSMSVLENLLLGAYTLRRGRLIDERLADVLSMFPLLRRLQHRRASTLSGGEQQLLSMGRALMLRPVLLLLDEPSFALSPNYVEVVFGKIAAIPDDSTSVLLVEQNARMALLNSDRTYVFQIGRICLQGSSRDLLRDPQVGALYLGL